MRTTVIGLNIVGNVGEGLEAFQAWCRSVLEFEPRATSRAAGLTQKMSPFEFINDTASFQPSEECLRLMQVAGIDIQDEVNCGLGIVHAGRYDETACFCACEQVGLVCKKKVREEVEDIARAREAVDGVAPIQLDALHPARCTAHKGGKNDKDSEGKGGKNFAQYERQNDEAKTKAERSRDKTSFCCQREGRVKSPLQRANARGETLQGEETRSNNPGR